MAKALKDFKKELLAGKAVRAAYQELAPEYAIAREVIKARHRSGLTQAQLAKRMDAPQSYVARLEGAKVLPTVKTLLRVAEATNSSLRLSLHRARPARAA